MAKIIVLPEHVSNKIAAGEVVERPASVVKELIENAIDAGAKKIEVDIKDGGQTYIRVADNGCGMPADDAALALQRHATSKIKSEDDLFSIKTLGFRGEALPSIAAVSQMKLTTRTHNSETGTFISIEGGRIKENRQTGAAPGTVIEIANLFFNTPARRKFLKTKLTEAGHITDIITKYCLSYPEIHFTFNHGQQQIYLLPAVKTIAERITSIWQTPFFKELIPIEEKSSLMSISGFIAKPSQNRSVRSGQYIFINKRPVHNNSISHALSEGFSGLLTRGRFPVAFLFLEIDPEQIDVNVHPTKNEVKLSKQNAVYTLLSTLVKQILKNNALIPSAFFAPTKQLPKTETGTEPDKTAAADLALKEPDKTTDADLAPDETDKKSFDTGRQKRIKEAVGDFLNKHQMTAEPQQKYLFGDKQSGRPFLSSTVQGAVLSIKSGEKLPQIINIFGQLNSSYILCQAEEGLLIMDQHAVHERILYEKLTQGVQKASIEQQILLIPLTLELTRQEALYLADNLGFWKELGFDMEEFGSDTFIIRSIPQVSQKANLAALVRDIIDELQQEGIPAKGPQAKEKLITLMACKLAIKAGQELKTDEIVSLLNQLSDLSLPYTCPHGRPTVIKLTLPELAKKFHRT